MRKKTALEIVGRIPPLPQLLHLRRCTANRCMCEAFSQLVYHSHRSYLIVGDLAVALRLLLPLDTKGCANHDDQSCLKGSIVVTVVSTL
jgi:hypothetical protein